MGEFKDHPSKKIIREQWCKPLIEFIHDALGYKLLYLGLPGSKAIDLLTWIEHIDRVIAFQCRDYPIPSSVSQSKTKVRELEEKLRELERQGKIATFAVYDGYIEEVILKGKDTNGNGFHQDDVVTIYNLDFCNGITTPLTIIDEKGDSRKFYKSETISKLIEIQKDISSETRCKKFIMFLTIHSGFWFEEKKRFISQTQEPDIKRYLNTLSKLNGWPKRIKLLKAYMYQKIRNFFCHCDFSPEFLPIIYYQGIGGDKDNWLMHFTFVGSFNKQTSGLAPCFQNTQDFLNQKFMTIKSNKLIPMNINGIEEIECQQDLVKAFEKSECYRQLWSKKKAK